MIKKRSTNSTNLRKRNFSSLQSSEESPTTETEQQSSTSENTVDQENVLEMKELISLRKEMKGIRSKGLLVQSEKSELPLQQNEDTNSVTKSGIFAMKQDKKKSFAEQKMEEHIEQEIQKRGLLVKNSSYTDQTPQQQIIKKEEDSLFAVPEHLTISKPKSMFKEDFQEEKTHKQLTLITEVTLPVEYKLKNIEETEKAAQELSKQNEEFASKNGANYHFQQTKQQKQLHATDDKVLEQFKKRYRK